MTKEEAIKDIRTVFAKDFADKIIKALEQEPSREFEDYENEIDDLHNRLDIAEYDKERLREEVTNLEAKIKALDQQPCSDVISRQAVLELVADYDLSMGQVVKGIHALPSVNLQESKTGHCKDCKWWRDSDGVYRRGFGAESHCPVNTHAVYCGEGYCYMFESQESEDKSDV